MAKPVGSNCNMNCRYCYYLKTKQLYPAPFEKMSDELLMNFIRQYISANPGPVISFFWHGGEPTLIGLPFYRQVIGWQKRFLPEGWKCWNNIQTNGLIINDEWAEFLAAHHFDVGISIDGSQTLHDQNRLDQLGNGTYERVTNAIRLLQKHGLQPDLLCTVNSQNVAYPLAVYQALKELNTGWMQFIPIIEINPQKQLTAETVDSLAYGQFLSVIFDQWIQYDLNTTDIQLFAEMYLISCHKAPNVCWLAAQCGQVLVLEHNGDVYSCDHFVDQTHRLGNINDTSLALLSRMSIQKDFGLAKQLSLSEKCLNCRWLSYCRGGCLKDRLPDHSSSVNYLCTGLQYFFAHIDKPFKRYCYLRKKGCTKAAIMQTIREEYY